MTDLQALSYAMNTEQESAKYYVKYAGKCKSKNAKALFEALAKMEIEHYEILEEQYDSLSDGGTWLDVKLEKYETPEIFLDKGQSKLIQSDLESELSDITVLRMAYLMENELADFYKNWSEKTTEPIAKAFLKKLADWENEHYAMLYKEYKRLMEDNWFEMGFAPF